jgi:membrane protease YdiL (CAAX protease family)
MEEMEFVEISYPLKSFISFRSSWFHPLDEPCARSHANDVSFMSCICAGIGNGSGQHSAAAGSLGLAVFLMKSLLRNDVFKIVVFVSATLVLGALLTAPVYWAAKAIVAKGWLLDGPLQSIHESLERAKLSRCFNRAMMAAALIFIYPTVRWLRQEKQGNAEKQAGNWMGLTKNPHRWRHLIIGFVVAAGTLLMMGWLFTVVGFYKANPKADPMLSIIGSALVAAFAVAFLEEFFFRGALQALALRTMKALPAILFVSAFFAVVHFLKPPANLAESTVVWSSGFWMIGQIFGQFAEPGFLLAEFATLFCVGWILSWVRMRTGSLMLGIGLHAGWVFGIKTYAPLTRRAMKLEEMLPWAGADLKTGLSSLIVVFLTGIGLWIWLRNKQPEDCLSGELKSDQKAETKQG